MNLETRKEELMDKLSEAYFAALKLKAEAEEQATQLETAQEGIWLDQENTLHLVSLVAPAIFTALATLEELPTKFPTH
jgi:hypothetical protein